MAVAESSATAFFINFIKKILLFMICGQNLKKSVFIVKK